jgi:MFS family permease
VFRGWTVVGGAFVVLFVAYGVHYSFGVFFSALLDEFGWSRASLSGAFGLYTFGYCLVAFPAGRLTDRWGPRAVCGAGGVLLGAAMLGMALVTRLWEPYVLYGLVAALGMGTAYVPCSATIVKWFVRRRGLAVGLASGGTGLGALVFPPAAQALVAVVGWRWAYAVFGVAALVVVNLGALLMRRDPESVGLHPDGDAAAPGREAGAPAWPLRLAARTPTFWLLAAAFTATWLPGFIPLVHLPRFVRDLGFSPMVGATVISSLGLGAIVGRPVMGVLSDRIGRRATVAVSIALQALAFAAFPLAGSLAALCAAAAVFGWAYGAASTLFSAIVGDFFGREQAGSLAGVLFALAGCMGGWGPFIAGAVYDATGGYTPAWILGAALNVVGFAVLVLCPPPRAAGVVAARPVLS